jgi:hypothetical protein
VSGIWRPFATAKTDSTSAFKVSKKIAACARYTLKATTAADAEHLAGESAPALVELHKVTLKLSKKGRTVTFTGKVSPKHAGKSLLLKVQKGTVFSKLAKVKLSKKSTFRFRKKLKKGTYAFRADMAQDKCHFAGSSAVRTVVLK